MPQPHTYVTGGNVPAPATPAIQTPGRVHGLRYSQTVDNLTTDIMLHAMVITVTGIIGAITGYVWGFTPQVIIGSALVGIGLCAAVMSALVGYLNSKR